MAYPDGTMRFTSHRHRVPESELGVYIDAARGLVAQPRAGRAEPLDPSAVGPDFEDLRWFWLPQEVETELARV